MTKKQLVAKIAKQYVASCGKEDALRRLRSRLRLALQRSITSDDGWFKKDAANVRAAIKQIEGGAR